uniref:Uncharacterized protein n=1 Tax=Salarias fasciatus TaxID=181472 RepID=A0A672J537_SALFA
MSIGIAILIIGFAALVALMDSDIPLGAAKGGKLHMVHDLFAGVATVLSVSLSGSLCHLLRLKLSFYSVDEVCRHTAKESDTTVISTFFHYSHLYPITLLSKKSRFSPVVLVHPVLQMADFNLPSYRLNHAAPILFPGRVAFCFLQDLDGDTSRCQEVLEGNHVSTELRKSKLKKRRSSLIPEMRRNLNTQSLRLSLHSMEHVHGQKSGVLQGLTDLPS